VSDSGEIIIERINRPNGGYRVRIKRADWRVRISLELLDLIQSEDAPKLGDDDRPVLSIEDGVLMLQDDYAYQSCYRLGDLDDTGRARWMEKL
jgi:hypothetical protein